MHIRKRRLELKQLQREVADLIGVTDESVRYWETGYAEPQIQHAPKIIAFLGYNPYPFETETFGGRVKYYRLLHGIGIEKFAATLNVDVTTIRAWENNSCMPKRPRLAQLNVLLQRIPSEADVGSAEAQPKEE